MDQIIKNIDTELPIYVLVDGRLPTRPSWGALWAEERIFDEAISSRQRQLVSSPSPERLGSIFVLVSTLAQGPRWKV